MLYLSSLGTHIVYVAWSKKQIPNSPFKVNVEVSPNAKKVRVSSLKGLISGETGNIIIDTWDAAEGMLLKIVLRIVFFFVYLFGSFRVIIARISYFNIQIYNKVIYF